jgi:hypothetical protein
MKINSPILEARWSEGVRVEGPKAKPPRWYCGLHSCTHWLAEYWESFNVPWYGRNTLHDGYGVLLLPKGFTKREFEGRVIYAQTKRPGHKLEVNRAYRENLEIMESHPTNEKYVETYRGLQAKLKTEKDAVGQLPLPTPALVQCQHCKRLSIIRKQCDGQAEIKANKELTLEDIALDERFLEPLEKAK